MVRLKFKVKRPNKSLAYHKRGIPGVFISSNDRIYASKLRSLAIYCTTKLFADTSLTKIEQERLAALTLYARTRYVSLVSVNGEKDLSLSPNRHRTIDSFEERQYWAFFKTTRLDLHRLLRELLFPDQCYLINGSWMTGEEVFLRGFYELVTGQNQFQISELVFGGSQPDQSRAFNFFIDHIHSHFVDLVMDNLTWWNDKGWLDVWTKTSNGRLCIRIGDRYVWADITEKK